MLGTYGDNSRFLVMNVIALILIECQSNGSIYILIHVYDIEMIDYIGMQPCFLAGRF